MPRWLSYTIIAAFLWGVWGVVSKLAADAISPLENLVWFTVGFLPPVLVAAFRRQARVNLKEPRVRRGVMFGFVTGIIGAAGNLCLFAALSQGGEVSVVAPLTAIYPLITVLAAAVILRERINGWQMAGIIAALAAVIVLCGDVSLFTGRAQWGQLLSFSGWLANSLAALLLWGFTGLTQKLSTQDVSARISFLAFAAAFVPLAAAIWVFAPMDTNPFRAAVGWAILGGTLNGFGSLASFAAYAAGGKASIVTPLAGLYPMVTVVLAFVLLRETIDPVEWTGIACALLAGVLLSRESGD